MAGAEGGRTRAHVMRIVANDDAPRLRVLSISAAGAIGGAERSLFELLRALPREKFDVHVCCPPDSPLSRLFRSVQAHVHEVPLRRFRRTKHPFAMAGQLRALHLSSREISALCRDLRIDVIHANTDASELVAWEVSRMTRLPHIWHSRDLTHMHGFAKVLGNSAAAVVAISAAVENHLLKEGVNPAKLQRIDNGIDLSRIPIASKHAELRQKTRVALGLEAHRPVLLTVGGYVPWKKHELFLETLSLLRVRIPSIVGLLVGSDQFSQNQEYENSLRSLAKRLALGPDILKILGQRDDVPELMCAADLLVSCSENEPFGRVLVEAGASSLPVVSTRSGGKPEILENNVTGILTEPGNAREMADACALLLTHEKLRAEMGRNARQRAVLLYDVTRTARDLGALFDRIPKKRETRRV